MTTFIDIIGLAASVKELSPLFNKNLPLIDIYCDSFEEVIKLKNEFRSEKLVLDRNQLVQNLSHKAINLEKLPIISSDLDIHISKKLVSILSNKNVLHGKKVIDTEVDKYELKEIISSAHTFYCKKTFSTLFTEAVRVNFDFLSATLDRANAESEGKYNEILKQIKDIFEKLTTQPLNIPSKWSPPSIPPLTPFYTGRSGDIKKIRALIAKHPDAKIIIHGIGGIGKTSLALNLVKILSTEFDGGVLWASLGPQSNGTEFEVKRIWAKWRQGNSNNYEVEEKLDSRFIQNWLSNIPGKLLVILDDIWHQDIFSLLLESLPFNATVIGTTRDAHIIKHDSCIRYELKELKPKESLQFLKKRLKTSTYNEQLVSLSTLLGHHPIALSIVASNLDTTSIHDIPRLIERIERHHSTDQLLADLKLGYSRDNNLEIALELSYKPLAENLKKAFLSLGILPIGLDFSSDLAISLWELNEDDLSSVEEGENRLNSLTKLSLLSRNEIGRYYIHINLLLYAKALLLKDEKLFNSTMLRYERKLKKIVNQFNLLPRQDWKIKISKDYPLIEHWGNELVQKVEAWLKRKQQPSLDFLVDSYTLKDYSVTIEEKDKEILQSSIDFILEGTHHYISAKLSSENSRKWLLAALVASHYLNQIINKGLFFFHLALWYQMRNKFQLALDLYNSSLAIMLKHGYMQFSAIIWSNQGSCWESLEHFDRALLHYESSLKISETLRDEDAIGTTLNNIGSLYQKAGYWQEALKYFELALPIRRRVGILSGIADTLNNLGCVYIDTKDFVMAQKYLQESLEIKHNISDLGTETHTLIN